MKESVFVKQNAAKWHQFEALETRDPDLLAERYIEITDDLSFAKTFFPESSTTAFLNGLASKFHLSIYRNKKEKRSRLITFWTRELPLLFAENRRALLYSFLFFAIATVIGIVSAKYDPRFLRLILGDDYVNMTEANIKKGDPFGVYKHSEPWSMFFKIAFNNIRVSFTTAALGLLASAGTLLMLVRNGIMLGSFEYFFFSKGLGVQSLMVIWLHGTIEISSIVIAGAAGLIIGNSILFPGTYSRLISFTRGAKTGMKIVFGLVPLFIVAAVIESFVTRHTGMPVWLSGAILAASLVFMIWYVLLFPLYLSRKPKPSSYEF